MVVDYKKEGKIAVFTLNQPPVNAINMELVRELHKAMVIFRDDPDAWVGVITGAGEKWDSSGRWIRNSLGL